MSQLKYWNGTAWVTAVVGAQGPQGATGPSGVIAVTSPITNSGTSTSATIGINQGALSIAQSQVTNLATDLGAKVDSSVVLKNLNQTDTIVEVFPRNLYGALGTAGVAQTTQQVIWYFFTPLKTTTVSQMSMLTGSTASSGITLARMGLYTFDETTATLVARTANDTTLFNVVQTVFTRSFDTTGGYPATYTLVAGQRYGFAVLQVGGTTRASLIGGNSNGTLFGITPRITAFANSQTDLPTSQTIAFTGGNFMWGRLS